MPQLSYLDQSASEGRWIKLQWLHDESRMHFHHLIYLTFTPTTREKTPIFICIPIGKGSFPSLQVCLHERIRRRWTPLSDRMMEESCY